MIDYPMPQMPMQATDALMRQRQPMNPDYVNVTQGQRPPLRYGQQQAQGDDQFYQMIQKLILEKYMRQIPNGGPNMGGMNIGL